MVSKIIQTEGISGIELQGPQSDRDREIHGQQDHPQFGQENKQDIQEIFQTLRETQLSYIDKIPELGLDTLQIHDLIFAMPKELTPPTVIRVDKDMINYKWHTLRTKEVQKVTSGHSTARIYVSLYFVGLSAINNGLRRLLAVFNSLPFVYIENSFIRKNLSPLDDNRNMACSLLDISVRTEPNAPDVLVADLTLMWFNYKPFATDFWFRQSWNSTLEAPKNTQAVYDREIASISDGPRIPSSDDVAIAEPLLKNDQTAAFSPPAIVPQDSEPLQYLIDSNLGPTMSVMTNRIDIGFREYRGVGALHNNTIDVGKTNKKLLREVSASNIRKSRNAVLKLHPDAAESFEELADAFAKRFSTNKRTRRLRVTSCYRTREMQRQLQKTKPDVATKGYSWHEVGLAIDIGTGGLTRAEYKWLIQRASNLGFKNLGVTSGYSPHFTDGGRWNDGGNPNATVTRPNANTIDSKGRLKNWETWHFDYKPTQERVKKRYGSGSTQTAIRTLRSMIHYTSVGLDATELVSETGDSTSLEKVRQRDEQAEVEIRQRLDKFLEQGWEVDPFGSDPVRILLYKDFIYTIEDRDKELIPQGITFAKSNIIPEIPILGHEFSTQQYMGSTDLDATISFACVGEAKVRELQGILETIQRNARIAKGVRDAGVIDISNSVLNFGGMQQAMIDKINTASVPDSPGLYQINIHLTQARRKEKQDLNRERYVKLDAWREASRWVVDNLFVLSRFIIKDLRYLANWDALDRLVGESIDNDLDMRQDLEEISQIEYDSLVPGTPGTDKRQWLIRSIELLQRAAQKYVYSESNIRRSATESKKYPGYSITYIERDDLYETPIAEVLAEYAGIVATIISQPFPKQVLFRLGLEKLADFVEDPFELDSPQVTQSITNQTDAVDKLSGRGSGGSNSTDTSSLNSNMEATYDFALKHYKNRLQTLWTRIYNEALYLHPVFGGLYTQMYEIFEQFRRGSECYPDLNLPPNVLTGSPLDTPPDYWFWNTSVDGNMFFDQQEVSQVAAEFMANSYNSMKEFVTQEEWERNYISPNKSRIRQNTSGSDSSPRSRLAALVADEAGIGTLGTGQLKGEVVNQVFDGEAGHNSPDLTGQKIQLGGNNQDAKIKPDESFESQPISDGYSGRLVDMLEKSMQNLDSEVYRLARAYPTFKVYFMEEDLSDSGRLGIRNFDDFYSYSAIKDIRIVRSRKIPADLCVISITNIHGELDTLAYGGSDEDSSARVVEKFNPLTVNTEQENPFTKLVVLEGSKIQVRLGYANSPDELDTVFTGQVVEVGVSPISPDIMQLVCQSYGTELVAKLKTGGEFGTTSELLSSLMCSEECFHFGRYQHSSVYDPAEVRSATEGESRIGFLGLNQSIDSFKENLLKRNIFSNKPQDDNIFAPEFGSYEAWGESWLDAFSVVGLSQVGEAFGIVDDDRKYYPWRTTIWDVFKEMELRHPGYVALPVPYGDRYTMFFGHPSHKYWSRPLSEIERGGWGFVEAFLQNLRDRSIYHSVIASALSTQVNLSEDVSNKPAAKKFLNALSRSKDKVTDLHGKEVSMDVAYKQFNEYLKWLIKGRAERYKPFRDYHFISSENNIVANNIKASAHGTFNGIEITYMDDVVEKQEVATEAEAQREILQAVQTGVSTLRLKADDNIEDHKTRMMEALYTTCVEDFFARRYAVSLLMRSLRDVYKGHITITGNAKIKPYDVCVLFDTYRDMYGPVEVEQVTHILSQETGFVTEIKPDLVLTHNAATTQCTMDAMVQALSQLYDRVSDNTGALAGTAVLAGTAAGTLGGTALLAGGIGLGLLALGGYKLVEWSQERQPIIITPVMNGVKPLIAGLDGYKRDSLWTSLGGKWRKFTDNLEEGFTDWFQRSPVTKWWSQQVSDWLQPSEWD